MRPDHSSFRVLQVNCVLVSLVGILCRCIVGCFSLVWIMGGDVRAGSWTIPSTELKADLRTGEVEAIRNATNGAVWGTRPFALFRVDEGSQIQTKMEVTPTAEGLLLSLRMTNAGTNSRLVTPVFPDFQFSGSNGVDHSLLRYCFPARSALVGTENKCDRAYYSGIAPLQFFAVDHPGRGSIHWVLCDTNNNRKLFGLDKTDKVLRLFVEHEARTLAPGQEWLLPPVLMAASGESWHSGLDAYRRWLASWYRPVAPRSDAFRKVFNFRVFYPQHAPPLGGDLFDPATRRWRLPEAAKQDARDFGGVDFAHLFDWARTPDHGRVGDYEPWDYLGGLPVFEGQIQKLKEMGIPVGLYLEGYLASPESRVAKEHGIDWAMLDARGKRVDAWGGGYYTLCPHVPAWQDYFAATCQRVAQQTKATGLYIDQFGFLTQYRCFNPAHAKFHASGAHMLAGEWEVLRKVRKAVGPETVLYTEEIPTDVMTRLTDGAYTASVNASLKKGIPCPIHLTRFALPDFKTIELISEEGLKENLPAVRAVFFNGEALYLSGRTNLFSPACMDLVRKTHGILRQYADNFASPDPTPLIPTLNAYVHANRFPAGNAIVWTLLHTGDTSFAGPVLRVRHQGSARYWDAWNGRALTPEITRDGWAVLSTTLEARGAGCVVQTW